MENMVQINGGHYEVTMATQRTLIYWEFMVILSRQSPQSIGNLISCVNFVSISLMSNVTNGLVEVLCLYHEFHETYHSVTFIVPVNSHQR